MNMPSRTVMAMALGMGFLPLSTLGEIVAAPVTAPLPAKKAHGQSSASSPTASALVAEEARGQKNRTYPMIVALPGGKKAAPAGVHAETDIPPSCLSGCSVIDILPRGVDYRVSRGMRGYGDYESSSIVFSTPTVAIGTMLTEASHDTLTLDYQEYSGQVSFWVAFDSSGSSETLTWSSDSSVGQDGWYVDFVTNYCGNAPNLPSCTGDCAGITIDCAGDYFKVSRGFSGYGNSESATIWGIQGPVKVAGRMVTERDSDRLTMDVTAWSGSGTFTDTLGEGNNQITWRSDSSDTPGGSGGWELIISPPGQTDWFSWLPDFGSLPIAFYVICFALGMQLCKCCCNPGRADGAAPYAATSSELGAAAPYQQPMAVQQPGPPDFSGGFPPMSAPPGGFQPMPGFQPMSAPPDFSGGVPPGGFQPGSAPPDFSGGFAPGGFQPGAPPAFQFQSAPFDPTAPGGQFGAPSAPGMPSQGFQFQPMPGFQQQPGFDFQPQPAQTPNFQFQGGR